LVKSGVIGHRQVTDAYLAALARQRGGRLATFDAGLAQLHPDVAQLVPTP
jgi:predicted nucleic acid-binding protein